MIPVFWGLALWQSTQRHIIVFVICKMNFFTLKRSTNKDYFNKTMAKIAAVLYNWTDTEQMVEKALGQLRGLIKMCAPNNMPAIGIINNKTSVICSK